MAQRGMRTVSRMGALQETMGKERRAMERWNAERLPEEPAGSLRLQAPYCFGSPAGMPASVEHLRTSHSLPQLPPRRGQQPFQPPPAFAPAAEPSVAALPPLGHREWLKERLKDAGDGSSDALSVYIMRKHSRRFLPGTQYAMQQQKPTRLLGTLGSEGLLPTLAHMRGGIWS